MPAESRSNVFRFDRVVVEPRQRRVLVDGKVTPVAGRGLDLLLMLVERAGELVHKDEIFERVWPGLVVEEGNLQVQVSALRKLIGAAAIETVPGHGYRFVSKVETSQEDESHFDTRSNLPRPLTTFVGDENRLNDCAQLLRKSRLLTVTGAGGLGKTRLSLEMAMACGSEFSDGTWFVDLSPITDPRLVSEAVALVVGVADQAAERLLEAVQRFMRHRHALLILDNCEHLLRGCAEVVGALLRACSNLTVVATSREPLHLQGEAIFPLPALSLPPIHRDSTLKTMAGYESVRLFVERASAVNPNFRLTEANRDAVCEICARTEGIPLALELAAARVRALSVEAIAARLHDRFRLLKNADRTAASRHETLRATIDWSYGLLDEAEKRVFERLSVFAGGWTLAAAEVVGAGGSIDRDDVLDLHSRLVDKSLVCMDVEGERYRMLETVRDYASERLEQLGEPDDARIRHFDCYVALAEVAEPHMLGPDEDAWHDRCNVERQNFLATYTYARNHPAKAESGLRLAYGLRRWICRGAFDVGRPVLSELLAMPDAAARNAHRCRGLIAAGFLSYYKGAYPDAIRYADEARSIAHELGSMALAAEAMNTLGLSYLGVDDRAAARARIDEAAIFAQDAGTRALLLDVLNSSAELYAIEGELDRAEPLYEQVLRFAEEIGSGDWKITALMNLTRVAISRSASPQAASRLRSAVEAGGQAGLIRWAPYLLTWGSALAAILDEAETAARLYGAATKSYSERSMLREPADERALAPCIAASKASLGDTAFAYHEAEGAAMRAEDAMAALTQWLAETTTRLRNPPSERAAQPAVTPRSSRGKR